MMPTEIVFLIDPILHFICYHSDQIFVEVFKERYLELKVTQRMVLLINGPLLRAIEMITHNLTSW